MTDVPEATKYQLNKTTNTIILDYLLWLSAKTVLEEGLDELRPSDTRSKGRRLVGLVDGKSKLSASCSTEMSEDKKD